MRRPVGILTIAACLAASACTSSARTSTSPRASLRLSRTTANELGQALKRLPEVNVEIAAEGGSSITSLIELRNGKTDISAPLADVAYLAYAGQLDDMTEPFGQLRGIAVTGLNTMHLLVRRDAPVRTPADLKGLRVSLGAPGSSTALITPRMLQEYGVPPETIRSERIPNAEIVNRLRQGDIDAVVSGFTPPSATVTAAMLNGARLVPIDGPMIEAMRTEYPYLKRTLIPRGMYPNQPEPIRTLGVDVLLVCRADLDEDLVHALLDAYFATRPPTTPPNLERAPATPIPLHPGAARYYRQRELSQ